MSATPWLKLLRNTGLLVLLTLLSVISSAQTQTPLFPTTSFFDAGAQVVTATGDFNGDGQVDLVTLTPNQGASIVTALLNQGDTTPPLAVTTAINLNPVRLVVVDMNNDKKLDLVTNAVSGGSAGIAVLFGNGDGTFQSPVFYPIVAPGNIVAVDLNGDGYPDLAFITAPTLTALKVAVLLNQGSSAPGTLSAPTSYPLSITFAQTALSISVQPTSTATESRTSSSEVLTSLSSTGRETALFSYSSRQSSQPVSPEAPTLSPPTSITMASTMSPTLRPAHPRSPWRFCSATPTVPSPSDQISL
jgi:hypothetical protein